MTIMDYQFFILLAPTLALVIYAVIDHIKQGGRMVDNAAGHLF